MEKKKFDFFGQKLVKLDVQAAACLLGLYGVAHWYVVVEDVVAETATGFALAMLVIEKVTDAAWLVCMAYLIAWCAAAFFRERKQEKQKKQGGNTPPQLHE